MAEKSTTKTVKFNLKVFINFLAFVAVVFLAIALILRRLIEDNSITAALELIAQIISYSMVAYYAFVYAKSKRNWIFLLVWALAVALIILALVLAL